MTAKSLPTILAVAAISFLTFGQTESRADGIPIDQTRTKITAPHTLFTMTQDQIEEAVALRTVTLTREQWAVMRKKAPGYPKRLIVVTHQYNDCSCGINGHFAIWLPDGKIGALNYSPWKFSTMVQRDIEEDGDLYVNIDRQGQFYLNGQLIPYASLKTQIKTGIEGWLKKGESKGSHSIGVGLPAEMTSKSVTLASRIGEIRNLFEDSGGSFWAF